MTRKFSSSIYPVTNNSEGKHRVENPVAGAGGLSLRLTEVIVGKCFYKTVARLEAT